MNLSQWWTTLSCAPADVGARIRVDGVPMPSGYKDPSGYIPPGQSAPSIFFDDEITEFGVLMVDDNGDPTGLYTDWTPTRLDNTSLTAIVSFDIGYWDENKDWAFVPIATAITTLGEIWDAHTYEAGTLAPPTQMPWRPDYFVAVPEPSTAILALLGVGMLLKEGKYVGKFAAQHHF